MHVWQVVFAISYYALPPEFTGIFTDEPDRIVKNWYMFFCVAVGLWGGLIIGIATEYFTSNRYQPVQVSTPCTLVYCWVSCPLSPRFLFSHWNSLQSCISFLLPC